MKIRLLLTSILVFFTITSAWAQYKLTVNFKGMSPHMGQRLELCVMDKADSNQVGRTVFKSITASDFSLDVYALVEGHSYDIYFFADHNSNGLYDTPPIDHAWQLTLENASQDTALDFTHNTNFTDIPWPGPVDFGTYEAVWKGIWYNETFTSTDSIMAELAINADSIQASFMTKGLFGNANAVTFDLKQAWPENFDWASDTLFFLPQEPWMGEIYMTNGQIMGGYGIVDESFGDTVAFNLTGSMGPGQLLARYQVTSDGVPFADGYILVSEDTVLMNIPTSIAELTQQNLPNDYVLQQNYPNPFNPSTNITFNIPEASMVKLAVYNLHGQLVHTLYSGRLAAGQHNMVWNGTDVSGARVASGVYLYRLEADGIALTKKLTLIK